MLLACAAAAAAADAPQHIDVRIAQRRAVQPASALIALQQGDTARITWRSDEAVELHVHGYDLSVALVPGTPVTTPFAARATGRFAVVPHGFGDAAGHGHGRALLYIEVRPR